MKRQPLKIEYRNKPRYHVYRSANPALPFFLWQRLTKEPLDTPRFQDHYDENDDTLYYYKMTTVDIWGKESEPFLPTGSAWIDKDGKQTKRDLAKEAVGYHVYRSTDKNLPLEKWERLTKEPTPDTSFTSDGLKPGVMYHYYVTSVNIYGVESKPSKIVSAVCKGSEETDNPGEEKNQ